MCVDYRQLNRITVKNRYPLPRIDDLIDRLGGASVFSSLDLTQGYILQDLSFAVVCLDDILIFSKSHEEHVGHVRTVLERLQKYQYYCKLSKCEFFKRSVTFLRISCQPRGFVLTPERLPLSVTGRSLRTSRGNAPFAVLPRSVPAYLVLA